MKRRSAAVLTLVLAAFFACGKKGPVMAPLVRSPQAVKDLAVSRVGNRVDLRWTNPTAGVDGRPLERITEVDVWVVEEPAAGAAPPPEPAKGDFEKKGRLLEKLPEEGLAALLVKDRAEPQLELSIEPDPADLAAKSMFFSLRVRDEKRRLSEFSEPVGIPAAPPLPPPLDLKARLFADRIELEWKPAIEPPGKPAVKPAEKPVEKAMEKPAAKPAEKAAGKTVEKAAEKPAEKPAGPAVGGYNVYRSDSGGPPARQNAAPIKETSYKDRGFAFGKTYVYFVRSDSAAAPVSVESRDSGSVSVDAVDTFPPAAPRGLTVVSGQGFIALSWEPSPETDLAGYRVWRRAAAGAAWTLVKELPPAESAYTDTAVENGRRYVYSITAFDRAGNESPRSDEAEGVSRRTGS